MTEDTEKTKQEERRNRDGRRVSVRRAGPQGGPACSVEADWVHEPAKSDIRLVDPIRPDAARRKATPVEPRPTLSSPLRLRCISVSPVNPFTPSTSVASQIEERSPEHIRIELAGVKRAPARHAREPDFGGTEEHRVD